MRPRRGLLNALTRRTRQRRRAQHFVDLLAGTSALRAAVDAGRSVDEIAALWQEDLVWFKQLRAKYFLYT